MDDLDFPGPAPEPDRARAANRRAALLERLGDGVALIPAAPELLKSRDTELPYRPSSDLYYLTGVREPGCVAVLSPHGEAPFTLFVRPRDPEREAWSGHRLGVEGARDFTGADAVYPIEELEARLPGLLRPVAAIHHPIGVLPEIDALVRDAIVQGRRTRPRSGRGPSAAVDLEATLGRMRLVKDAAELETLRTAARLGAAGHRAAMAATRPGRGEWELQAALEACFRERGAASPAFPSIVGTGNNATVLHYVRNESRLRDGELVLVDAGAEWGLYCSDITRTFPVSGRFTAEQRALYEIVLAAEEAAIESARPGATIPDVHAAAVRVLAQGLLDLGVLAGASLDEVIESGRYRDFYLHQTSHWLGLDVHDVGPYRDEQGAIRLEPGMVLTIEPGLYFPEQGIGIPDSLRGVGIRIEDDVVVTSGDPELLTRGVPVRPEEIEELIGSG